MAWHCRGSLLVNATPYSGRAWCSHRLWGIRRYSSIGVGVTHFPLPVYTARGLGLMTRVEHSDKLPQPFITGHNRPLPHKEFDHAYWRFVSHP
jgi:hypothetical protein